MTPEEEAALNRADGDKLDAAKRAAHEARLVLENPAVQRAFATIEANAIKNWRSSRLMAENVRQESYHMIVALDVFKRELEAQLKHAVAEQFQRDSLERDREFARINHPGWQQGDP